MSDSSSLDIDGVMHPDGARPDQLFFCQSQLGLSEVRVQAELKLWLANFGKVFIR